MIRTMFYVAMVVGLVVGCVQVAIADGSGTHCPDPAHCTVTAQGTDTPSSSGTGDGSSGPAGGGGGGSSGGGGGPAPSAPSTPTPPPCTYAAQPSYQPPAGTATHAPGSGAWYQATCYQDLNAAKTGWVPILSMVWLSNPPPPAAVVPSPAQLAAEAQSQLTLTTPVIESNPQPGLPQMVDVPMWSWLVAGQFAPVSATASVPGVSVTATATPAAVVWNFGDGTSLTCAGPGTAYVPGSNPLIASPTCGHTYTRSSGSGTFTVSATVEWNVTWAGAGLSGAFNNLATTATEQVRVEQNQALVTGG
jgi:hypothetical protein